MEKVLTLIVAFFTAINFFTIPVAFAQEASLEGIKICLDPGHGGHDGDDRETDLGVGTLYYESDANWEAVGYLDSLLQSLGAVTKLTKLTNDPDAPDRDPSLSDRVQVANAFGADYFHSFHTNGSDNQTVNYSLVLYAGPEDGTSDFPESVIMSEIMDDELFKVMRTNTTFARADIPFTGFTNGLGVLNNLNMPSALSEASFHSNISEGRRLMNSAYLKNAAWSLVKTFLQFYEAPPLQFGEVGGIVTDNEGNPLNGIEVTFAPGTPQESIYIGDSFLNGFYLFDRINPGTYDIEISKFGYDTQIKSVTVEEGLYTEIDASLNEAGDAPSPPVLTFVGNPGTGSGLSANWLQNPETTLLGYRLYFATNDSLQNWVLAADENLLTATQTSVTIEDESMFLTEPGAEVYHFKLTSVAISGAESEGGDIYSRSSNIQGDRILIVDGFDRISGSYTETFHDFATDYFLSILDVRIAEVHTAANEAITEEQVDMLNYDMVVWFLGDESTNSETFSTEEQTKVSSYLQAGGKLFVSGSEIAWDLDNKGDESDRAFFNNYLKASFVGDGSINFTPATGIEGTEFENSTINFGITYVEDFPDDISPENGANSILAYAVSDAIGGVAYKGTFGDGVDEGGIVYISFGLETANSFEQKLLMKDVLSYLDIGEYIPIPPSQPVLLEVAAEADLFSIQWEPSTESNLEGYRLYYSLDNTLSNWKLAASEITLSRKTEGVTINKIDFIDETTDNVFHFKLTGVSDGGFESAPSDTYSASDNGEAKVLIVDGFDRVTGSYSELNQSFAASYHQGLQADQSFNISTVANESTIEESFDLSVYEIVFWFLGDESTVQETFSTVEQQIIIEYLEQGGKLFVSGSEVGWDLVEQGNSTDQSFFNNYLKANFVSDGGAGRSPASGLADTDFSDLEIAFGEIFKEDYPDEISPYEGSSAILKYSTGLNGAVAYTGTFGDSDIPGKLVYFGFPLESADDPTIKEALNIITRYFEDDAVTAIQPKKLSNRQLSLYPNPSSNTSTTLEIVWDESEQTTDMQMVLINLKGQEERRSTLKVKKGVNQFDLETQDLKSGLYIIHLYHENQRMALKLMKR